MRSRCPLIVRLVAVGTKIQSRSRDRVQDHPTIGDEGHEEAEGGTEGIGPDLAVLDVDPDEDEALEGEEGGGDHGEGRSPV